MKRKNIPLILTLAEIVIGCGIIFLISKLGAPPTVLLLVSVAILLIIALPPVIRHRRRIWAWLKERVRKGIVSLKRKPSTIPLVMLLVTFLLYSLNLTSVSNTTAKIQGAGMGLAQFSIMLFSLLSMVCLLNAFPRRKKPNVPMIVIMYVMLAIIAYCDIHYTNGIMAALNRAESPIVLNKSTEYIANAYNMLNTHLILIGVTAALVALLPVYSKLLKKINTSVTVEDNGAMGEIELND